MNHRSSAQWMAAASLHRHYIALALLSLGMSFSAAPIAAEPMEVKPPFQVPAEVFVREPRGPYATGTFEELWINDELDDPSTAEPHDKRKVMVQVWYPAELPKKPRWAPYAISPQLYAKDHWVHKLAEVRTQSALGAPVAAQPSQFPVLIYNHGGSHPHFSGTFQTELLASHGYVVVAIGHPGANKIERFPDGSSYVNDGDKWLAEAPAGEKLASRDEFEHRWARSDLGLFVKDISFVLDRLAAANADPKHRFGRRLDLDRVGSLGWSLGGFVSLQASRDEPRIKAAANLDGWPYGLMGTRGAVTLGTDKPVLLMFGESVSPGGGTDADSVELSRAAQLHYWTMLRRSTADWYYITLARASHDHFCDRTLFEAPDPESLHPRAAHTIINAYTLAFFDKHVRGAAKDSLLLSGSAVFHGATVFKRKD